MARGWRLSYSPLHLWCWYLPPLLQLRLRSANEGCRHVWSRNTSSSHQLSRNPWISQARSEWADLQLKRITGQKYRVAGSEPKDFRITERISEKRRGWNVGNWVAKEIPEGDSLMNNSYNQFLWNNNWTTTRDLSFREKPWMSRATARSTINASMKKTDM